MNVTVAWPHTDLRCGAKLCALGHCVASVRRSRDGSYHEWLLDDVRIVGDRFFVLHK